MKLRICTLKVPIRVLRVNSGNLRKISETIEFFIENTQNIHNILLAI